MLDCKDLTLCTVMAPLEPQRPFQCYSDRTFTLPYRGQSSHTPYLSKWRFLFHISRKLWEIGTWVVLRTDRKSYMSFHFMTRPLTLNDLGRSNGWKSLILVMRTQNSGNYAPSNDGLVLTIKPLQLKLFVPIFQSSLNFMNNWSYTGSLHTVAWILICEWYSVGKSLI